jgi:hypothetical protein
LASPLLQISPDVFLRRVISWLTVQKRLVPGPPCACGDIPGMTRSTEYEITWSFAERGTGRNGFRPELPSLSSQKVMHLPLVLTPSLCCGRPPRVSSALECQHIGEMTKAYFFGGLWVVMWTTRVCAGGNHSETEHSCRKWCPPTGTGHTNCCGKVRCGVEAQVSLQIPRLVNQ